MNKEGQEEGLTGEEVSLYGSTATGGDIAVEGGKRVLKKRVSIADKHEILGSEESPLLNDSDALARKVGGSTNGKAGSASKGILWSSVWSSLIFTWMRPLLVLGNDQQKLDPEDLAILPLPHDCVSEAVAGKFQQEWSKELSRAAGEKKESPGRYSPPSVSWACFRAFGWDFIKAGGLKLIHDLAMFVGPQVLFRIIHFLNDPTAPLSYGLWLTLAVTVAQLLMAFCVRHYFFKCYLTGLRLRTSVVVAVYQKALAMSSSERNSRSAGEITNLMSIDALRMQDLTTHLHAIWFSFLQIGIAFIFLWQILGPSCLAGIAAIIVMIPLSKIIAEWIGRRQTELMEAKDKRIEVNAEVLSGIKVIKLQAWEESFETKILGLRKGELRKLSRYFVGAGVSDMLWTATPAAVAVTTFGAYVLAGNQLHVATALTSLALFDILRFPLFKLPQGERMASFSGLHVCLVWCTIDVWGMVRLTLLSVFLPSSRAILVLCQYSHNTDSH